MEYDRTYDNHKNNLIRELVRIDKWNRQHRFVFVAHISLWQGKQMVVSDGWTGDYFFRVMDTVRCVVLVY